MRHRARVSPVKYPSELAYPRVATSGIGVVTVQMPVQGVVLGIFAYGRQGAVVADGVFVIIALPDRCTRRVAVLVDAFGDGGFEPSDSKTKPFIPHDFPKRIQHHLAIYHLTEQVLAFVGADGDKIRPAWV